MNDNQPKRTYRIKSSRWTQPTTQTQKVKALMESRMNRAALNAPIVVELVESTNDLILGYMEWLDSEYARDIDFDEVRSMKKTRELLAEIETIRRGEK